MTEPCSVFAPDGNPWVPVPDDLTGNESRVWRALWKAAGKTDLTEATDSELALATGLHLRSIARHLRDLETKKWITRTRSHGGRVITLLLTKKEVERQLRKDRVRVRFGKDGMPS